MEALSTYGLYSTIRSSAVQLQQKMANANIQESTGLVSTSFTDYGSQTRQMLSLESAYTRTQARSTSTQSAADRVQAMYSAVGNMITEITNLRSTISSAMSGTTATGLNENAQGILQDLAGQMNSKLDGRSLFGGSDTDSDPVDLSSYPATSPPSATTADTSYYKGNSTVAAVQVSDQQSISYGVTGNNSAFEQALRAAAMVSQVTTSPTTDTTTLQSAYDLAGKALTALSDLQQQMGYTANRLSDAQTRQTTYLSLTDTMVGNIKDVDVAQAKLDATNYETQLQASYSALSSVLKLKLTDYL